MTTLNALTLCNACDFEQMHDGCNGGYCYGCCPAHQAEVPTAADVRPGDRISFDAEIFEISEVRRTDTGEIELDSETRTLTLPAGKPVEILGAEVEVRGGAVRITTTDGEPRTFTARTAEGATVDVRVTPGGVSRQRYLSGSLAGSSYGSTWSHRASIDLNGSHLTAVHGNAALELTAERAAELAQEIIDARREADRLARELEPVSAYLPRGEAPDLPKAGVDEVTVGDVVWVYSRGNVRRGKVEKVGRTKVHVVYVSSTGTISRKADSHVWLERRVDLGQA